MKKTLIFCLLLTFFSISHATPIRHLVFFGDSYMDDGNLYKLLLHVLPKSPPYYEGRFSNGPTFAERIGQYYQKLHRTDYKIYALGGATSVFHLPTSGFFAPATLYLEVEKYLLDNNDVDRSNTLYILWIGDNDYMFYQSDEPNEATQQVINGISDAITRLMDHGARRFLIFNLMDTTRTPLVREQRTPAALRRLILMHNKKLSAALNTLRRQHHTVTLDEMDVYTFFNDVLDNPAKYNLQEQVNITNTTQACWTGGMTLDKTPLALRDMDTQLQQTLNTSIDTRKMTQYIAASPMLAFVYQQSYGTFAMPCAHPEQYIFWDPIHPTATVHELLARNVIKQMNAMDWPAQETPA